MRVVKRIPLLLEDLFRKAITRSGCRYVLFAGCRLAIRRRNSSLIVDSLRIDEGGCMRLWDSQAETCVSVSMDEVCGDAARLAQCCALAVFSRQAAERSRQMGIDRLLAKQCPIFVRVLVGPPARTGSLGGTPDECEGFSAAFFDVGLGVAIRVCLSGSIAWPRGDALLEAPTLAIMNTYNEVDIIAETVEHLIGQGVRVKVFDNWSSDGTWEQLGVLAACHPSLDVLRFPDAPTTQYEWRRQLENTSSVASEYPGYWIIHTDADEIRQSPWPGVALPRAFAFVESLGYNAVDFGLLNFRYTTSEAKAFDPATGRVWKYFEFGDRPGHYLQIKAWKSGSASVDLASSGGHSALFPGRRVYPLKFLLRHFPLRSPEQARQKIFVDRAPRIVSERTTRNWHRQYEGFTDADIARGWDERELKEFDSAFWPRYSLQVLLGMGAVII